MVTDARKHTTLAPGEVPRRAALAAAILSVNDVVPVSGATEQVQVAQALQAAGVSLGSVPLVTARADAPPMHRIEYSYDGVVFLPASGLLHFATEQAANTWAQNNAALLTPGDRCIANGTEYVWQASSTWRLAQLSGTNRGSGGSMQQSVMTQVALITLPANSPAGAYLIGVSTITGATASGNHYQQVKFANTEITDSASDFLNQQPANVDIPRSDTLRATHGGGAANISLAVQVNAANPYLRAARLTVQYMGG